MKHKNIIKCQRLIKSHIDIEQLPLLIYQNCLAPTPSPGGQEYKHTRQCIDNTCVWLYADRRSGL